MKLTAWMPILLLVLLLGAPAQSFDAVEEMMFRSQLEKTISDKFSDAMATRVPREDFSVSVQVFLQVDKSKPVAKESVAEALPAPAAVAKPVATAQAPATEAAAVSGSSGGASGEGKVAKKAASPLPEKLSTAGMETPAADQEPEVVRPDDLLLGMINAEELISRQKEEIETLRAQVQVREVASVPAPNINIAPTVVNQPAPPPPAPLKEERPQFKIARVQVTVGIASRFGGTYVNRLKAWLNQRVKEEFGPGGFAVVERMAPKAEPKPEPRAETPSPQNNSKGDSALPPAPQREPHPEDRLLNALSSMQNFLGLLVIALVVFAGANMWRAVALDPKNKREISVNLQGDARSMGGLGAAPQAAAPALPMPITINEQKSLVSDEERGIRLKMTVMKTRELTMKIGALSRELTDQLEELVEIWLEGGEDGHLKTACLIDAIMNYSSQEDPAGAGDLPVAVPVQHERHLSRVFQMMAQLDAEKKATLLEEAYWDLVSLKTLENEKPRRQFSYLRTLESDQLQKVMQNAEPRMRAVAFYHLEPGQQDSLLSTLNSGERKDFFANTLSVEKMSTTEVESFDQRLRELVKGQVMESPEVEFRTQAMQLLSRLTPLEEMDLLPALAERMADRGASLKRKRPSLAFADSWSLRARQLVFSGANAAELTAIIRVRPALRQAILEVCPPRVVGIVEEDLANPLQTGEDAARAVGAFNYRLQQLLSSRELTSDDLVSTAYAERTLNVA